MVGNLMLDWKFQALQQAHMCTNIKGYFIDKKYFRWNTWVIARKDLDKLEVGQIRQVSKQEKRLFCKDSVVGHPNRRS